MIVWLMVSLFVIMNISFIVYIFSYSVDFSIELGSKLMEVASCVFVLLYFLNILLGWGWSLL